MAMYARWTKSGYNTAYSEASISASYSNGVVRITLTSGYQWTPNTTFRLHGSSEQVLGWDWFCGSKYGGRGRTVTFTHNVTQNGTYSYYVSVDHREMDNILNVGRGVRGHLTYDGSTGWVSVNVTDRYVPKVIASANISEVSRNSRPALQVTNARNTDGSQANIQVNVNGSGWQPYSEGMTFTNYAPGSTITVQLRNSDTPGTVITKTITLSYGIQPTAQVSVLSVIQNTCDCMVSNSNGSYTVSNRQWSLDNTNWHSVVGQSFTISGLQYNTSYKVYYRTTFTENIGPSKNFITVSENFKTPLPSIEHSISAIDTFKHIEDKSGSTDSARFKLVLKEGITLQTIFLGIQEYTNFTYDENTQELVVRGLSANTIYTITAFGANSYNEGEYATIKFQTNGQIFDALLEDPTSGNHIAPITFIHNIYNNDFSKTQDDINKDVDKKIEALSGIGGPIDAIDFNTEFGTNNPTQAQLTKAFCEGIWGEGGTFTLNSSNIANSTYVIGGETHYAYEIFSATWVRNSATGERWVLTNTQDTTPKVFEIANVGIDTVSQFSNTQSGIIKGSTSEGKVSANSDGTGTVNGYSTLKNNVSTNTTNISNLTPRVTKNETDISSLNTKVTKNETDISSINSELDTIQMDLTDKVDKISGNNKLYGTDSSGNQISYDYTILRTNKDVYSSDKQFIGFTQVTTGPYTGWYSSRVAVDTYVANMTKPLPIVSGDLLEINKFDNGRYQAETKVESGTPYVYIYSENDPGSTTSITLTISIVDVG